MGADDGIGHRSNEAARGASEHGPLGTRWRGRLAAWEDRLLRGPGRILDHPILLRLFVVVGVLAASALSFNLVETAPSSGLLGGGPPVGSQSAPAFSQGLNPQNESCGNEDFVTTGQTPNVVSSPCATTTVTKVVPPTDAALKIGDTWSDSVTVSSTSGAPPGTVTFYECSPAQLHGSTSCTSSIGTQIPGAGNPATLKDGSGNSSSATSPPVVPTSVGQWCFAGYYSGQTNNYSPSKDTSSSECFTVNPDTPGMLTSVASPGETTVGHAWSDLATVFGNAAAGIPTGSVSFTLCKESTPGTTCTGGAAVATDHLTPNGYSPSWSSVSATPASPGTYCFNAAFNPASGSNYAPVPRQGDDECFVVAPVGTTTTTKQSITQGQVDIGAGGSVSDTATVTGDSTNGPPTGTVFFWLCWFPTGGNQHCEANQGIPLGNVNLTNNGTVDSSGATSVSYSALNALGTYCFSAAYTPAEGSNYGPSTDNQAGAVDENECFKVNPADPGFSTQQSGSLSGQGSIGLGGTISDTATVTGNAVGGAPTGKVTFYECGPTSAAATCAEGNQVGSGAVSLAASTAKADTSTATSAQFTPKATGTYCFAAVYTPAADANYNTATDNQSGSLDANECFVVTEANFRVLKTDQPGNGNPVTPGSTVPYTVQIQNIGNGTGSATVTDVLPSNLSMVGTPVCAVTAPDTCAVANTTGSTWTFTVSLAAAHEATVTFDATVAAGDTVDVVNTATITKGACDVGTSPAVEDIQADAAVSNCTSTVTNPVPNFTVSKTDGAGGGNTVQVGSTITYTIVAKNVGDGAGSTTVTDVVPAALTVTGTPTCAATAPDTCTVSSPATGTWKFTASLASGHTATATINAVVTAAAEGTTVANTATIGDPCNTASGCSSTVSNPVPPGVTTSAVTTPPATSSTVTATNPTAPTGPVTSASSLAFTGAYLGRMALLAVTLLGTGACVVLLARRRRIDPKHAAKR